MNNFDLSHIPCWCGERECIEKKIGIFPHFKEYIFFNITKCKKCMTERTYGWACETIPHNELEEDPKKQNFLTSNRHVVSLEKIKYYFKKGTILDIGCRDGAYLDFIQEQTNDMFSFYSGIDIRKKWIEDNSCFTKKS